MASHPSQMSVSGRSNISADAGQWSGTEQYAGAYDEESPGDGTSHQYHDSGVLPSFTGMQKKLTRDGQPAKRRGPKPDSKPAQTRRQELNRQAQRTHRERKEHYIKALEIEVSRLREAFAHESTNVSNMAKQHDLQLRDQRNEILILRDMLTARGIQYENELASRKAGLRMTGRDGGSLSPQHRSGGGGHFLAPMPGPPSSGGYSTSHEQSMFSNGSALSPVGHSPGTHQGHSPSVGPQISEQARQGPPQGVPDMPGIFEKDPQLGVDFILSLEATCRDHEEYLVRRSASSPNDPEGALFSGHALMASCPPPSHIDNTPARNNGLEPTYPHQTPQVPMETLQKLLNLSKRIKADGFVEGGQVTPVMALQSLRGHRNYQSLTRDDIVGMIESIRNKVRCYGFGAVMEDFELRDAIASIFATKPEAYEDFGNADIEDMYS